MPLVNNASGFDITYRNIAKFRLVKNFIRAINLFRMRSFLFSFILVSLKINFHESAMRKTSNRVLPC